MSTIEVITGVAAPSASPTTKTPASAESGETGTVELQAKVEVLEELNALGIPWHVTSGGTLWTATWQATTPGFVSAGEVAGLPVSPYPAPRQVSAMEWVSQHLDELHQRYAGRYVAVLGNTVVADSERLPVLLADLRRRGIRDVFLTHIPRQMPFLEYAF